jgi:hypothetical protein
MKTFGEPMRRLLMTLLLLLAATGCSRKAETTSFAEAPRGGASRYLAYEHSIALDTDQSKIAAIYEAGQAACRQATADLCTILEARISTGRDASASLKFRAKPSGIPKLIAALGKQAEITNQSTSAEDLAAPIEDAGKKLAMLNDYRTKLEALRDRAGTDVDALIKVNRELAQVQGELEAIAGKHAHLMQRVDTEILNVAIRADHNQSFWRPIGLAMSDFGTSFSQGISIAIAGVAYLIPWVFIFGFMAWAGRKLWRRRKQPKRNG